MTSTIYLTNTMNHRTVVAPGPGGRLPPIPYHSRVYGHNGMLYAPLPDDHEHLTDRMYRMFRGLEIAHELRELRRGNAGFTAELQRELVELRKERDEMRTLFLSLGCPGVKREMSMMAMWNCLEAELKKAWTMNAMLGAKLDRFAAKHPFDVA